MSAPNRSDDHLFIKDSRILKDEENLSKTGPAVNGSSKLSKAALWRRVWTWHFWLGLFTVIPLLYWMGTAFVFALWPIQTVRGISSSTGQAPPVHSLQGWMLPPPEMVEGARSVVIRYVEGHPVAVLDREAATEIWDLEARLSLGPVLPLPWAREAAQRDFSRRYEEETIYLFPRSGSGVRLAGSGPDRLPLPPEYTGPLPAYAFHLRPDGTHLYVDALTGELRARRTGTWRSYDLAFRLHSFDFLGDMAKRAAIVVAVGLWMALGGTGLAMAFRKLRKPSPSIRP